MFMHLRDWRHCAGLVVGCVSAWIVCACVQHACVGVCLFVCVVAQQSVESRRFIMLLGDGEAGGTVTVKLPHDTHTSCQAVETVP